MAIHAIGDLHLSFSGDKPMDIFGDNWANHADQIRGNWCASVAPEDLVLLPGDTSWALHFPLAKADLDWLMALPGKKALLRGNHDYWWTTLNKMKTAYPDLFFLQNNVLEYGDYAICGSRGWICPGTQGFDDAVDMKIYQRELIRLQLSLEEGKKTGKPILAMIHYPPCNDRKETSGFTELFEAYGVELVLYGHIHTQFGNIFEGVRGGVEYRLVSSDYIRFSPVRIRE